MTLSGNNTDPEEPWQDVSVLCRGHSVQETWPPVQDDGWSAVVALNYAAQLFSHSHIAYIDKKPEFLSDPGIHITEPDFRQYSPLIFGGKWQCKYTAPCLIEALGNGVLGIQPREIHVFGHDMTKRDGVGGPPRRPQAFKIRWEKEWELWQVAMESHRTPVIFH
jgi:hypothetical protein